MGLSMKRIAFLLNYFRFVTVRENGFLKLILKLRLCTKVYIFLNLVVFQSLRFVLEHESSQDFRVLVDVEGRHNSIDQRPGVNVTKKITWGNPMLHFWSKFFHSFGHVSILLGENCV
jgi:hypothetical protein